MTRPIDAHARPLSRVAFVVAITLLAGCRVRSAVDSTSSGSATAHSLEVGAATRTITPALEASGKPVWLAGYGPGRKATRVHDDLFARALVIRDDSPGGRTVAICIVDLIGFFRADVLQVREALARAMVPVDVVIVASTHTHSGPDTMGLWGPMFGITGLDREYNAHVRARCVEAITEAVATLRSATARLAVTTAPGLVNDSRLPRVLDERLRVIAFDDARSGEAIATLVNWSCHPECLPRTSTEVTADFCAPLLRRLERERGGVGVFATGAIGGLMTPGGVRVTDPKSGETVPEDTRRHADVLGELLAQRALDALATAPAFEVTPIRWRSREVDIPLENDLFRSAAALGLFGDSIQLYTDGRLDVPEGDAGSGGRKLTGRDLRTEVGLLQLGRASILCVPGEIYPELVFGGVQDPADPGADHPEAPIEPLIEPMLPAGPHLVIGLANDEIGYVIPRRQWDTQPPFAYGRKSAQYGEVNSVGPSAAASIATAVKALVDSP